MANGAAVAQLAQSEVRATSWGSSLIFFGKYIITIHIYIYIKYIYIYILYRYSIYVYIYIYICCLLSVYPYDKLITSNNDIYIVIKHVSKVYQVLVSIYSKSVISI